MPTVITRRQIDEGRDSPPPPSRPPVRILNPTPSATVVRPSTNVLMSNAARHDPDSPTAFYTAKQASRQPQIVRTTQNVSRNPQQASNILYANSGTQNGSNHTTTVWRDDADNHLPRESARQQASTISLPAIPLTSILAGQVPSTWLPVIGAIDFGEHALVQAVNAHDTFSQTLWKTAQGALGGYQYGRGTEISIDRNGASVSRSRPSQIDVITAAAVAYHEGSAAYNGHPSGFGEAFNQMAGWVTLNLLALPYHNPVNVLTQNWGELRNTIAGGKNVPLTQDAILNWNNKMLQDPIYAQVYAQVNQAATAYAEGYPDPTGGSTAQLTVATTPLYAQQPKGLQTDLSSTVEGIVQLPIDIQGSRNRPIPGPKFLMLGTFLEVEEAPTGWLPQLSAWKYQLW